MKILQLIRLSVLLGCLTCLPLVLADDAGDDAYNDDAYNDDANYDDDAYNDDAYEGDDAYQQYQGDDYIKYWTDYALLPKRCIVHNDVDVIVFSLYSNSYKQCSNDPMGTYITPVPTFVDAYMEQLEYVAESEGEEYEVPDAAQYTQCTQVQIQNQMYYVQLGCTDGTSQSLSANIYSDNTCETRSVVDGYDDSNIDVSAIKLPFKQCKPCVNWIDANDDNVDDQFYENIQTNAPLCLAAWQDKEECDRKCQRSGLEHEEKDGWNTPDKILIVILSLFGAAMLVGILNKRRHMSNKDSLLEQAAMSAAGLQQAHVIGIFIVIVLVIAMFALLGLKNITWALLLIMNTVLFGYLMKLTVDSGVSAGETMIGPDGTVIRRTDSDDSSVESVESQNAQNAGTYKIPELS